MIKELMHDPIFLAGKSEVATKEEFGGEGRDQNLMSWFKFLTAEDKEKRIAT